MARNPIALDGDREPWDRQPAESLRQYSRFRSFLELGRTRTLTQVAEMLHALGDKINARTLRQYAYIYRWTERAEAHDRHQDHIDRQRLIALDREMRERHRRLAAGLTAKAVNRLTQITNEDMDPLDVVRFIRLAAALERTSLGQPDQTVGVSGPNGGPVVVEDLGGLTEQERRTRLRQIGDELVRRSAAGGEDDE